MKKGTEALVAESDELPVFRSESGALMTLPGGVLLILDPEWSRSQTDAFFSGNAIKLDRVSELGFVPNGFFVETEPGFPSPESCERAGGAGWGGGVQPQLVDGDRGEVVAAPPVKAQPDPGSVERLTA